MTYFKSPAPHIHSPETVTGIIWKAIAATVPMILAALIYFPLDTLRLLGALISIAALCELLFSKVFGKKLVFPKGDLVLSAILFGLMLPHTTPVWMAISGVLFSIFFGRQIFGGMGRNPFQLSCLALIFLQVSFPEFSQVQNGTATSMNAFSWIWGYHGQALGEVSLALVLISGILLLVQKYIYWEMPLIYMAVIVTHNMLLKQNLIATFLTSQVALAAFFLLADPSCRPLDRRAQRYFYIFAAALFILFNPAPVVFPVIAFSVLIANAFAPLIDLVFRKKPGIAYAR